MTNVTTKTNEHETIAKLEAELSGLRAGGSADGIVNEE